jgi:hypothetical protein
LALPSPKKLHTSRLQSWLRALLLTKFQKSLVDWTTHLPLQETQAWFIVGVQTSTVN